MKITVYYENTSALEVWLDGPHAVAGLVLDELVSERNVQGIDIDPHGQPPEVGGGQ